MPVETKKPDGKTAPDITAHDPGNFSQKTGDPALDKTNVPPTGASPDKTGDPVIDNVTDTKPDAKKGKAFTPSAPGSDDAPYELPELDAKKVSDHDFLVSLAYIVRNHLSGDHPQARDRLDLLFEANGVDDAAQQKIQQGFTDRMAASIERLAAADKVDKGTPA